MGQTCQWDDPTMQAAGEVFQSWMYDMSQFDYTEWMPSYEEASLMFSDNGVMLEQACYDYALSIDVTAMDDNMAGEMM